jgi:uncharacterized protein (TIGR03435 family)
MSIEFANVCLCTGLIVACLPKPPTYQVSGARSSQTAESARELVQFEVATIKPVSAAAAEPVETIVYPAGRVVLHKQSLKGLLCIAFDSGYWEVEGNNPRLNRYYDIEAEAPEVSEQKAYDTRDVNGVIEDDRLRKMLQALLIERFGLKFHREMKASEVYSLELSGKALRLHSADTSVQNPLVPLGISVHTGSGWTFHDVSMQDLAKYLSRFLRTPVLDRTGFVGTFDFTAATALTEEDFHGTDVRQTLMPVLSEMGLRLVRTKGRSELLVVDRLADPSAN